MSQQEAYSEDHFYLGTGPQYTNYYQVIIISSWNVDAQMRMEASFKNNKHTEVMCHIP